MMDSIKMRRIIGKDYKNYEEYIKHQKEKTNNPTKRKKWLNKEWDMKINIFRTTFQYFKDENILKENMKCLCFGARTGQEVVALNKIGMKAIGIDIVPEKPYVIEGDVHDAPFGDESFDFVFTNIVDHSIYPEKFMTEIERVLKPGCYSLIHLQLNCKSDKYAENDIYNSESVIKLLKNSQVVVNREITEIFTKEIIGMNWEILMKKNKF